jgi:hypothetical protein
MSSKCMEFDLFESCVRVLCSCSSFEFDVVKFVRIVREGKERHTCHTEKMAATR